MDVWGADAVRICENVLQYAVYAAMLQKAADGGRGWRHMGGGGWWQIGGRWAADGLGGGWSADGRRMGSGWTAGRWSADESQIATDGQQVGGRYAAYNVWAADAAIYVRICENVL